MVLNVDLSHFSLKKMRILLYTTEIILNCITKSDYSILTLYVYNFRSLDKCKLFYIKSKDFEKYRTAMRFEGKENLCRLRIYQISGENQMFPIFVTNVAMFANRYGYKNSSWKFPVKTSSKIFFIFTRINIFGSLHTEKHFTPIPVHVIHISIACF